MLPKKACDVNRCEVARIMKLTGQGDVEPLPFIVPRKFEGYQPDVYPPPSPASPLSAPRSGVRDRTATPSSWYLCFHVST